jgi:lycopene cyclase domain-containing protein
MSLYLLLNIIAISLPLLLSFDKRVHFYTHWKFFFPAMILTLVIFIIWDVIFTGQGVWGFNERYHGDLTIFGLPLEEFLFFISVPYASVFSLYVMAAYFPGLRLNTAQVRWVTIILLSFLGVIAVMNISRAYTAVNFLFTILVLVLVYFSRQELLSQFYISYLVILIPFGIINGILTGSFIEEQVVWYNDQENLGFRIGTIPFEDIFYGMSLILMNYYLTETFRSLASRKNQIPK